MSGYLAFSLNGTEVRVCVDPSRPLLDVLRDDLGLTGTKRGCDYEGECGACTVLIDGRPVRSCLTPVGKVAGRRVLTVEGLADGECLHPLQQAFLETGAVQCGFCTPGMLLTAKALLDRNPDPTRDEMLEALSGNLCRCTGYESIVRAISLAAARIRGDAVDVADSVSPESSIGGGTMRSDALAKVTGRARFVEDVVLEGMLHVGVIRSPHHHARLLQLDVTAAARVAGIVRIITSRDLPGDNGLGGYSRDEPLLAPCDGTVRMRGAPVALVVGETLEAVRTAAPLVRAEYEVLPHTFDAEEAVREDAYPIGAGGNLLGSERVQWGDITASLATSERVFHTTYRTACMEHTALERESVLSYLDDDGRVTIVAGNHEPHWAQDYAAATLALDPADVRVIVPPTGGSFGGKQDPWPLIAAGVVTYLTRHPARLIYTRNESFDASPKRHPYRVDFEIGVSREGLFTGNRARVIANTGAYDAQGFYIPSYALVGSGGAYRWQAVDMLAQSVYTNNPKCGQFRGFGTPQSTFALECTLDEIAETLDVDPLELRLRNALREGKRSALGYPVAESFDYCRVLEAARPAYRRLQEEAEAFNARRGERDVLMRGRHRMGVGLAGMWYRFGKSGALRVEAHAELASDGHFRVFCSAPDYGQGTNTVMSQLAAEALGVSRDLVELINADTALTPDSGIQGASRSTYWVGNAVCGACRNLLLRVIATAAEMLDCSPEVLCIVEQRVVCRTDASLSVSLESIARELTAMGHPLRVQGIFDASPLFPGGERPEYVPFFVSGAHVAQVIVDLRTGEARVRRVVAIHDVGRAINPVDARGQIEGGVVMGLGAALTEEYIPGITRGLSDYYPPTAYDLPEIEVILVEAPSRHGPHGAKGLGEACMVPSTPAIINGVCRAIGARLREIPATPERVLAAIDARWEGEQAV